MLCLQCQISLVQVVFKEANTSNKDSHSKGVGFPSVCRDSGVTSRNMESAASLVTESLLVTEYLADPKSEIGF